MKNLTTKKKLTTKNAQLLATSASKQAGSNLPARLTKSRSNSSRSGSERKPTRLTARRLMPFANDVQQNTSDSMRTDERADWLWAGKKSEQMEKV